MLALQLVQELQAGQITWKGVVLGGRAWKGALPPDGWPAAMPAQGTLEVDCKPVVAGAGGARHTASRHCLPLQHQWVLM